jgi:uncharacterized membrane-anchored protein
MASLTVSSVSAGVWVLDDAQVVVFGAVAAVLVAVVGGKVMVALGSLGCRTRGWGARWSAVDRSGSKS